MNARQEIFVREYVRCGVAAEAARRAGYSEKTARHQGHALLTNPDIKQAVRTLRKDLAKAGPVTREQWIENLARMAMDGASDQVRVRASQELGKALGWYEPERHEHVLSGGITFVPLWRGPMSHLSDPGGP